MALNFETEIKERNMQTDEPQWGGYRVPRGTCLEGVEAPPPLWSQTLEGNTPDPPPHRSWAVWAVGSTAGPHPADSTSGLEL